MHCKQCKGKDVLRQIHGQELFCLRDFVVSTDARLGLSSAVILHHKQRKGHFSWRVTWQGDFCQLEETANLILSWYSLILVDTELALYGCAGAQHWQVLGADIASGSGTVTLCIMIVIIVRGWQRPSHIQHLEDGDRLCNIHFVLHTTFVT